MFVNSLKYFIKYSSIVLQNKIADLLQTSLVEGNSKINVRFNGGEGKCWLGYANNKNKAIQILFSGDISKHVKNNVKLGDYLKISVVNENDIETIVFEKVTPKTKKIKLRSNRYSFISVRPDWIDNRNLIGFYNPITESYQSTELLKLMLRANENKSKPFFVILDEMNLAKVEHYFSDFLSCLESRRIGIDGKVKAERLILHDSEEEMIYVDEEGRNYKIPTRLEIPENIYFTGTVNVDESTYMFSPKVLDRANVIEFNELDLDNYEKLIFGDRENNISSIKAADENFVDYFTDRGEYCRRLLKKEFNSNIQKFYKKLRELNGILEDYHLHFGYRVIDEIMMYLSYGHEYNPYGVLVDLDLEILQKVLPKLYGNRKQLEISISRMLKFCFNVECEDKIKTLLSEEKKYLSQCDFKKVIEMQYKNIDETIMEEPYKTHIQDRCTLLFPRSARKLYRMITMLERQGYTSFIE